MNTFSHVMIGDFLTQYIREHEGIILNRDGLINGSVIPDFRTFYKSKPHEPAYWENHLQSEIRKLSAMKQESARFGSAFSWRLGVICHFYADFFCFPHTAGFEGGTYAHMRYEWALNRRLRGRMPFLDAADFGDGAPEGMNAAQIVGMYRALHRDYLAEPASYDNDIVYTLQACIDVISAVTANARAGIEASGGMIFPLSAGATS